MAANPETGCVLIASDLSAGEKNQWALLGYRVEFKKGFESLTAAELAALLKKGRFGIHRKGKVSELRFSLTDGKGGATWKPLSVTLPAKDQMISKDYSCFAMNQRVEFYRQTRTSLRNTIEFAQKGRVDHLGETLIDLENSFYLHMRLKEGHVETAKNNYRFLLERTKQIAISDAGDFFEKWQLVRALVFDQSSFNLDYCRDKDSMIQALTQKCTNCVGETYLLAALFMDAGFSVPKGWVVGTQGFLDHVRPVLYHEAEKMTYDMVDGKREARESAIYVGFFPLVQGLWRGHGALRFPEETKWMNRQRLEVIFSECFSGGRQKKLRTRATNLSLMTGCTMYTESEPPERADNQHKANRPVRRSAIEEQAFQIQTQPEAQSARARYAAKGDSWIGQINKTGEGTITELLQILAKNLNPQEGLAISRSILQKGFTEEVFGAFSLRTFLTAAEQSQHMQDPKYSESKDGGAVDWSSIVMPLYISDEDPKDEALAYSVEICHKALVCIKSKDKTWLAHLKSLSAVDRWMQFQSRVRDDLSEGIRAITEIYPAAGTAMISDLEQGKELEGTLKGDFFSGVSATESLIIMYGQYYSPWGLAFSFAEEKDPLKAAMVKTLIPSAEIRHFLNRRSAWQKSVLENHRRQIQFLEESSLERRKEVYQGDAVETSFKNLVFILAEKYKALDAKYLVRKKNEFALPIQHRLLERVLLDEKYFFTAGDKAKKVFETQPERKMPEVNLPVVAVNECRDGEYGFVNRGFFVLDCGKKPSKFEPSSAAALQKDPREKVSLEMPTWSFLLGAVFDRASDFKAVEENGLIKILIHHAMNPEMGETLSYIGETAPGLLSISTEEVLGSARGTKSLPFLGAAIHELNQPRAPFKMIDR